MTDARRGRPPLPPSERHSVLVRVHVTPPQDAEIRAAAEAAGEPVSAYALEATLERARREAPAPLARSLRRAHASTRATSIESLEDDAPPPAALRHGRARVTSPPTPPTRGTPGDAAP